MSQNIPLICYPVFFYNQNFKEQSIFSGFHIRYWPDIHLSTYFSLVPCFPYLIKIALMKAPNDIKNHEIIYIYMFKIFPLFLISWLHLL